MLGGRPGETLAQRLAMPVGADTLLRLLRRRAASTTSTVRWFARYIIAIPKGCWHPRPGARPGIEASIVRCALKATIALLCANGLLERQQRLASPADIASVAVVHPPAAADWVDIASELQRRSAPAF